MFKKYIFMSLMILGSTQTTKTVEKQMVIKAGALVGASIIACAIARGFCVNKITNSLEEKEAISRKTSHYIKAYETLRFTGVTLFAANLFSETLPFQISDGMPLSTEIILMNLILNTPLFEPLIGLVSLSLVQETLSAGLNTCIEYFDSKIKII